MDAAADGIDGAAPIAADDDFARYEYDRGSYFRADGSAKAKAFAPELYEGRLETSVFRTVDLSPEETWALGDLAGQGRRIPKAASGLCHLVARDIRSTGLALEAAEPPERHVVIVNWPDAPEQQLDCQNMLARFAAGTSQRRIP